MPASPFDFLISAFDLNGFNLGQPPAKIQDCIGATGRTFTVRLNDAGDFGFEMPIRNASPILEYAGRPFVVVFSVNGGQTPVYTGIAWTQEIASGSPVMKITGKGITSWFANQFIAKDYTGMWYPLSVAFYACDDCQKPYGVGGGGPGSNPFNGMYTRVCSLDYSSPNMVPLTSFDYRKSRYTTVAQVLSDVSSIMVPGYGGVDYYVIDSWNQLNDPNYPASFVPSLMLVSPRAGKIGSDSGLAIDIDRSGISFRWTTNSMNTATHVIVVGGGSGNQSVPAGEAFTDRSVELGFPTDPSLMSAAYQYTNVSDPTELQRIARGLLQQYQNPVTTPEVTIPVGYPGCKFGAFGIGDDVLIRSGKSMWFPQGLYQTLRIVAYKLNIPDAGMPTVTLTLNHPPVY